MIPRRLLVASIFFVVLVSILTVPKFPTRAQDRTEGTVSTATFKTSAGEVRIYLPADMAAGDTISGTVVAAPAGKDENERQKNASDLSRLVIQFENQRWPVRGGVVQKLVIAPALIQQPLLILLDEKGGQQGTAILPVLQQSNINTTPNFVFPVLGQSGRSLPINGPFDGDSSNTNIQIGGSPVKIIAESPRNVVVRVPPGTAGPTDIAVDNNGHTAKGNFRALKIDLSAPKTSLTKGESTELHVAVNGLEGITQPVQIQIENQTPSNISIAGGNTQNVIIQPSQVTTGGTFNWSTNITGIGSGGFNITGTVTNPSADTTNPAATATPLASPPPSVPAASPAQSSSNMPFLPAPAPTGSPESTFTRDDTDCCKKFLNDGAFAIWDDKGNGFSIFRNKLSVKIDGKNYEWEFTQDGKPFYIEWMFCHLNDNQVISQLSQVTIQRVKGGDTNEIGDTTSVSLHGPYRDSKSRRPSYGFQFGSQKIGTDTREYGVSFTMDAEFCAWSCQLLAEDKVREFRTNPARSAVTIFNSLNQSTGLPSGAGAHEQQAWWNAMYSYFFEIEDWLLWINNREGSDLDETYRAYNVWRVKLVNALGEMSKSAAPDDRGRINEMLDLLKNTHPSPDDIKRIEQKFDELHLRYGTKVPPEVRKQILRNL